MAAYQKNKFSSLILTILMIVFLFFASCKKCMHCQYEYILYDNLKKYSIEECGNNSDLEIFRASVDSAAAQFNTKDTCWVF